MSTVLLPPGVNPFALKYIISVRQMRPLQLPSGYFPVLHLLRSSMCTVLLPPGVNPFAVNKYIIPCHIISVRQMRPLQLPFGSFPVLHLLIIRSLDAETSELRTSLTLRRLTSYIYMEHPFLMFLDHTRRRSTVGRTPLDE